MCSNESAGGALAGIWTASGAKVRSVGAVLACLLPNRHLLLPSRLEPSLRGERTAHITCLLRLARPAAWLHMDQTGVRGEGRGIQVGRYLDLEVGLNAQRQHGTAPKGVVAGAVHGRGVSQRVGATPKAKTCTCTPAYARPPAAPGRTPSGIC